MLGISHRLAVLFTGRHARLVASPVLRGSQDPQHIVDHSANRNGTTGGSVARQISPSLGTQSPSRFPPHVDYAMGSPFRMNIFGVAEEDRSDPLPIVDATHTDTIGK